MAPPFAVRGDLAGLLLVWVDADGIHTARNRAEIPEQHREMVRVDSLAIPPEQRPDPSLVFVADLRRAGPDGSYPVRQMPRAAFEALADRISGVEPGRAAAAPSAAIGQEVILYSASWCGACKSAARLFRERGVAFVEKDIERDRAALAEMQQKAQAAGVRPSGVPVIDFRGTILTGFNRRRLEALIEATPATM